MKKIAATLTLMDLDYTKLAEKFGVSRTLVWLAVKGKRTSKRAVQVRSYVDKLVAEKGSPVVIVKRKTKNKL